MLIQQATQTVNSPQHRHSDDNGGGFFSWLFGKTCQLTILTGFFSPRKFHGGWRNISCAANIYTCFPGGGTVDYNTQTFSRNGHDDGAGDPRRTDGHLRQALDHFSNVFSVSDNSVKNAVALQLGQDKNLTFLHPQMQPGYLPLPAGLLQVTGELLSHSRTYPIKVSPEFDPNSSPGVQTLFRERSTPERTD